MGAYDKLSMAEGFLQRRFGWNAEAEADQVVFVGDSPQRRTHVRPLSPGLRRGEYPPVRGSYQT